MVDSKCHRLCRKIQEGSIVIATVESVYPQVEKIIADVLAMDEGDIQLNKSLVKQLGAESIDFLDLIFRLEREFKIKIPRGKIEKDIRVSLDEGEFEKNGFITPDGMKVLRDYLSEVPSDRFTTQMKVSDIPALFTVETFCKLVINTKNQA